PRADHRGRRAGLAGGLDEPAAGATEFGTCRRVSLSVRDAIAIVGLGCRFAGGASDGGAFWRLLVESRDAVAPISPKRWDHGKWIGNEPGKTTQTAGGFIEDIDQFRGDLFGHAPRATVQVHEQPRLVLDVT